jgi:phage host-nuclease inhibitor protein Gam
MLEAAKEESWDTVTELEALRREVLKSCFAIPLNDGNGELLAEALAALLHLNEEIMSLLKIARHQVAMSNRKEIDELAAAGEYYSMQSIK